MSGLQLALLILAAWFAASCVLAFGLHGIKLLFQAKRPAPARTAAPAKRVDVWL